jgi:hypothetical protein
MRVLPILLAIVLAPSLAVADDNPQPKKKVAIPDAATLIGKTIEGDRQYEIGSNAPQTKSGDWSYGFGYDDPGLERSASSPARGKADSLLDTSHMYDTRCAAGDKASFSFGAGDRFKLKGTMQKGQYADAWIYLGDGDAFDAKPLKIKMDFSQNDAAMHFDLDPTILAPRSAAAICPDAAAPGKTGGHCAMFSLKGFARAYDFVCQAK